MHNNERPSRYENFDSPKFRASLSPGKHILGYVSQNCLQETRVGENSAAADTPDHASGFSARLLQPRGDRVKSGDRALRVLEFFHAVRRPAKASEIADALEMPRSSAHELLYTMVDTGFLTVVQKTRLFFPSFRIVRMGNFIEPFYFGNARMMDFISELSAQTCESVALSIRNNLFMQMVAVDNSSTSSILLAEEGSVAPILDSAAGCAYLMTKSKDAILAIVRKVTHRKVSSVDPDCVSFFEMISSFRRQGYSAVRLVPDVTSIAVPIRNLVLNDVATIGFGGNTSRIWPRVDELGNFLAARVREFSASYEDVATNQTAYARQPSGGLPGAQIPSSLAPRLSTDEAGKPLNSRPS